MANDKSFRVKNGLQAGRYLQSAGTETAGSEAYSLAGASYDSVSFSVATEVGVPLGLSFKNDGTKMYVTDNTGDSVDQYSLSTAYDITTASYDSKTFSFTAQETGPRVALFNSDGTKMYTTGAGSDAVFQYSLSTAWDVSTASYDSVSLDVSSQDTAPTHLFFKTDGTKMYMFGGLTEKVYQYSLSTGFDLSTASYDSISFDVSAQDTQGNGLTFNPTGTKFFITGGLNDSLFEYSLSTSWDVSSASYSGNSLDISSETTGQTGLAFNGDGTKLIVVDSVNDRLLQYSTALLTQTLDLSTGTSFSFTPSGATTVSFTNPPASGIAIGFAVEINGDGSAITWPSSVKWHLGAAPTATASKEVYTFITTDGGTSYVGKRAGQDIA